MAAAAADAGADAAAPPRPAQVTVEQLKRLAVYETTLTEALAKPVKGRSQARAINAASEAALKKSGLTPPEALKLPSLVDPWYEERFLAVVAEERSKGIRERAEAAKKKGKSPPPEDAEADRAARDALALHKTKRAEFAGRLGEETMKNLDAVEDDFIEVQRRRQAIAQRTGMGRH